MPMPPRKPEKLARRQGSDFTLSILSKLERSKTTQLETDEVAIKRSNTTA